VRLGARHPFRERPERREKEHIASDKRGGRAAHVRERKEQRAAGDRRRDAARKGGSNHCGGRDQQTEGKQHRRRAYRCGEKPLANDDRQRAKDRERRTTATVVSHTAPSRAPSSRHCPSG